MKKKIKKKRVRDLLGKPMVFKTVDHKPQPKAYDPYDDVWYAREPAYDTWREQL